MSNHEIVHALFANNQLLWDLQFNLSDENGHRDKLMDLIRQQRDKNALLANRLDARPSRRDKGRTTHLAEDAIRRGHDEAGKG